MLPVPEYLQSAAAVPGISFGMTERSAAVAGRVILLGTPGNNQSMALFCSDKEITPIAIDDPQGYQIISVLSDSGAVVLVCGSTVLADVYGLYRIIDRIRITGEIPMIDEIRIPELKIRFMSEISFLLFYR